MILLQRFCVFISKEIVDLVSLKTRKVHLHSCEPLTGITEAQTCVCRGEYLFSVLLFIYFYYYAYVFFKGNEEDSDEIIGMERATPISSGKNELDQRTGLIGTVTAADDEEVLVILRSMKSAVIHFVGDKKYLSA